MWLRFLSIDLAFRISTSEYIFELAINSFYLQIRVDIVLNERQPISEKGGCRLIIYSSATVEVMEDSKILVISPDPFETLLMNSPEIAMKMLKKMVLRLRALDDKLEQVLSEIPKGPDLAPMKLWPKRNSPPCGGLFSPVAGTGHGLQANGLL